ncbi:sulfatase-like hydrolase/transferase [Nocardioides sp.]|uniref:sulfatase-like hydrolase/transferase n=1 Tax=Nocardioides sp. TaxID=35761 RepID=UPI0019C80438|nr:sulfatase-like hydrolase/transferase [Nocardioides sp.]MBC7277043.1 sulfatase-like hydrolase/transferase [Nocardioides sp.]
MSRLTALPSRPAPLAGNALSRVLRRGRNSLATVAVASTVAVLCGPTSMAEAAALPGRLDSGRPSVLMINVDDLAATDIKYMPNVQRLLVQQGTTFTDAVAPTPLCVPARASLLTGKYAHNHKNWSISGTNGGYKGFKGRRNTLPVWMDRAGYRTMFLGKYLNGYGKGPERTSAGEPGWDDWQATIDPSTYNLLSPKFNNNGTIQSPGVYSSVALQSRSVKLIKRAGTNVGGKKPWFLWVNYVAPHSGGPVEASDPRKRYPKQPSLWFENTRPMPVDKGRFRDLDLPRTPNMFHAGPGQVTAGPAYSAAQKRVMRYVYQQRIESAQSVDRAVAKTVAHLKSSGQYRRTVIIFSGDNGYTTGQHNRLNKFWETSQASRIPLVVVGPGIPKNVKVGSTVGNPDIATTVAALGRATPGRSQDGVDITRVLASSVKAGRTLHRPIPVAAWPIQGGTASKYRGIRYGRYTYATLTASGVPILYDRAVDPYETRNLARDPSYAKVVAQLKTLEARYRSCSGSTCPKTYAATLATPSPDRSR